MKIAICIPAYDGKICAETMFCLDRDVQELRADGHVVKFSFVLGTSLITKARRMVVQQALDDAVDALILLDADHGWEQGALKRLVGHDVDLVGAAFLQKTPEKRTWTVTLLNPTKRQVRDPQTGLLEVTANCIGLAVVKRIVFDKINEKFGKGYFDLIGEAGEDDSFNVRWREVGGKIWVDPDIETTHIATPNHRYTGRFRDTLDEMERERARYYENIKVSVPPLKPR